jgi:hypothetical protein
MACLFADSVPFYFDQLVPFLLFIDTVNCAGARRTGYCKWHFIWSPNSWDKSNNIAALIPVRSSANEWAGTVCLFTFRVVLGNWKFSFRGSICVLDCGSKSYADNARLQYNHQAIGSYRRRRLAPTLNPQILGSGEDRLAIGGRSRS